MKPAINKFWEKEENLTVFLLLLILFIFVIDPIAFLYPNFRILIDLSFGIVLISGIWSTIASPKLAKLAVCFVIFAVGSSIAKILIGASPLLVIISELCDVPAVSLLIYVCFKQIMKPGPITTHRVQGAIASFLLLGILWAKLYTILVIIIPNSFSGIDSNRPFTSLIYFSFVTLTTAGYGDILPTHVFSRSLANAESLIGQLFPAIFIARLVGMEIEQRKR